jgi:hypothetical protein
MYTYILGAGASCPTLPLANKLNESLQNFLLNLKGSLTDQKRVNPNQQLLTKELINEVSDLIQQSSRHQTIDTYAKMLYLTKETKKYDRLRFLLTLYFQYEQAFQNAHNRYDHLLATILKDDTLEIPEEFTFLSWNYDYQFEKAISLYLGTNNYFNCKQHLNLSSITSENETSKNQSFLKLNGTAFFLPGFNSANEYFGKMKDCEDKFDSIAYIIDLYEKLKSNNKAAATSLSFAWSKEKDEIINSIKHRLEATKILIVIGYSFPYFNRTIDLQIFKHLTQLEKIIIQTEISYATQLESKIKAIWPHKNNVKTELVTDTSQFFVPYEYNSVEIQSYNVTTFL